MSTGTGTETYLKKRQNIEAEFSQRKADKKEQSKLNRKKAAKKPSKTIDFTRVEKFVSQFRKNTRNEVSLRRKAKMTAKSNIPDTPACFLVIRIYGTTDCSLKVRKILQTLRLRYLFGASLILANEATESMLKQIAPYVVWGVPSRKTIHDLIYKRGYAKINGERITLSSNQIIEEYLGDHGVICLEDIVQEIFTAGENFRKITSFLYPFKLNAPVGSFSVDRSNPNQYGTSGFRENIDELAQKMI